MIKVHCHTNLDSFRLSQWPKALQVLPRIGDKIQNKAGERLQVIEITHTEEIIFIELHRSTLSNRG